MGRFTDDDGLFQGGKYGRFGGRFRDWWEQNTQDPYGHRGRRARERLGNQMDIEEPIPETYMKTQVSPGQPEYQEEMPLNQDVAYARGKGGALDFNPSDPESVRVLQKRLNQAGYVDQEGNPLQVDATFGPKTEFALRTLQKDIGKGDRFGFGGDTSAGDVSQLVTSEDSISNQSLSNDPYANVYKNQMDNAFKPFVETQENNYEYNPWSSNGNTWNPRDLKK